MVTKSVVTRRHSAIQSLWPASRRAIKLRDRNGRTMAVSSAAAAGAGGEGGGVGDRAGHQLAPVGGREPGFARLRHRERRRDRRKRRSGDDELPAIGVGAD